MKRIVFALVLFAGLFATKAYPVWFPHDAIREEGAQMTGMMQDVRGMLEAQREILQGNITAERRDELLRQNAAMTGRIDEMMAEMEKSATENAPPYKRSYELGSFLRSVMQRK